MLYMSSNDICMFTTVNNELKVAFYWPHTWFMVITKKVHIIVLLAVFLFLLIFREIAFPTYMQWRVIFTLTMVHQPFVYDKVRNMNTFLLRARWYLVDKLCVCIKNESSYHNCWILRIAQHKTAIDFLIEKKLFRFLKYISVNDLSMNEHVSFFSVHLDEIYFIFQRQFFCGRKFAYNTINWD